MGYRVHLARVTCFKFLLDTFLLILMKFVSQYFSAGLKKKPPNLQVYLFIQNFCFVSPLLQSKHMLLSLPGERVI